MSFNIAFEITSEDVANVIHNYGKKATEEQVETLFDMLDTEAITSAALHYDEMDAQTDSAYEEITRQLKVEFDKLPSA